MKRILLLNIMCITILMNAQTKDDMTPVLQLHSEPSFNMPIIDYSEDLENLRKEISEIKKQLNKNIISNTNYLDKLNEQSIEISSKSSIDDLQDLKSEVTEKINILNTSLEQSTILIEKDIDNVNSSLDVTNSQLDSANNKIINQREEIIEVELSNDKASKMSLISLILAFLLIIALIIIYKLASKNKTSISSTKDEIKKILELDKDLKILLEKQTQLLEQNKEGNSEEETLKSVKMVADQIATMENNIYQMDPNTRGLSKIVRAIRNLKNNFQVMGYTIPVLLGKEWQEGDEIVIIGEKPDESIEKGKKIITRVVTPCIVFKGEKIQRAKVELKSNK